jgi:hypothetical protein
VPGYQRTGQSNTRSALDWVARAAGLGKANTDLHLPFRPGFGTAELAPSLPVKLTNGLWSGEVRFLAAATNAFLVATDPSGTNGASALFEVRTAPLLSVEPLGAFREGSGVVANGLRLRADFPVGTNVIVRFTVEPEDQLLIPLTVELPAGASQLILPVVPNDDHAFDGRQRVVITPYADGFTPVSAVVMVDDDEAPQLTLVGPATIEEGGSGQFALVSSMIASRDIEITLAAATNSPLLSMPATVTLPAGAMRVEFPVAAEQDNGIALPRSNWVGATWPALPEAVAPVLVLDDEPRTLTL